MLSRAPKNFRERVTHYSGPRLLGFRFRWRGCEGELELGELVFFFLPSIGPSYPEPSARSVILGWGLRSGRMAGGRSDIILESSIKGWDVRASIWFRSVLRFDENNTRVGTLTVGLRWSMECHDKSLRKYSHHALALHGG